MWRPYSPIVSDLPCHWVLSMFRWRRGTTAGARRLLTLKTSRRRLGGQPWPPRTPRSSRCRLQSTVYSVRKVYSNKTADWIRMPFGMVSGGRSRDWCIRWGWQSSKRKGQIWGWILGVPCNQCGLCCIVVRERRALPKLLWERTCYHYAIKMCVFYVHCALT